MVPPSDVIHKFIDYKWVCKGKPKTRATEERHKARLVAKGLQQKMEIDFNETFAPVTKLSFIRPLFAFVFHNDLFIHQVDVMSAFLNGKLDENIYMRQPEGFVDKRYPDYV